MNFDNRQMAGLLLFSGTVQFVLLMVVGETVYPNYNAGQQAISDLGNWSLAGNFAAVFAASSVLWGALIIASAYLVRQEVRNRLFVILLALTGACNMGVGIVAENIVPSLHGLFALVMFVSWAVAALASFKFEKSPFSYVSVCLGAVSLVMLIFSLLGKYAGSSFVFGFGAGGLERLVVYPLWLWTLGFGAYLMGASSTATSTGKT